MEVTAALLRKMAVGKPPAANVNSVVTALNGYGERFGVMQPHRLTQYLCQLLHESASFRYDQEIASGAAYEGRRDLGNTKKGDGKRFKGRGPIQITGRANYRAFTAWCRKHIDADCPDFEAKPELINTDPWEGLGPLWYWDEGNPDPKGRSLNYYADKNDIEMVTRRINGGINGLADRIAYYDRAALVILGYAPPALGAKKSASIEAFQKDAKRKGLYLSDVDGMSGPRTRAALHESLLKMADEGALSSDVAKAPVVEEKEVTVVEEKKVPVKVPEAVKVPSLEKPFWQDLKSIKEIATGFGTTAIAAIAGVPWQTVAVIAGVAVVGLVGLYLIRRNDKAKQDVQVQKIEAKAAVAEASI